MRLRALLPLFLALILAAPLAAQDDVRPPGAAGGGTVQPPAEEVPQTAPPAVEARPETGGAQTLEDILRRQRGEEVDDTFRRQATGRNDGDRPTAEALGTLGGVSDPEIWRQLRFDSASIVASNNGPASDVLIQDGGMPWLKFRHGPLPVYGGYALLAVIALLAVFLLIRGRIGIEGEWSGRKLPRFKGIERFGHWTIAVSFLLLGFTGLYMLFGRDRLMDLIGRDSYAAVAQWAIWIHNNVAWAFMLGLVMVTVMWIAQNLPRKADLIWLAKGGGMFSKHSHPPAYKFNAGQKLIFWAVVILGVSISLSGLSLLFPFQMPLFSKTFEIINETGAPGWFGYGPLPVNLEPQEEMQLAQSWHAIVAFVFLAVIIAHIYIGTIGMRGAFEAMGKGEVDEQWAREHHNLWVRKLEEKGKAPPHSSTAAHPAE